MKSQQSSDKPNTTGIGPDSDKQADLLLGIFIMSVSFKFFSWVITELSYSEFNSIQLF